MLKYLLSVGALALSLALSSPALADDSTAAADDEGADTIVVFGRGETKIGTAGAASEGSVSGSDLLVRPLLRTAELLEAVPGMVAAQHSGSGKANQYFLRGFNLDHGSDFTTYIDGVQMNFRTHGHGHGYLDLNGLIPEVIAREDYRKGPYRADGGDFALAGAAYMTTIDGVEVPWVSAEAGSYGWRRQALGGTIKVGEGALTLVGQVKFYNGPFALAEKLRHYAGFGKYSVQTGIGKFDLSFHAYRGTWLPTEQIPERIVGSSICADVFCSPDPSAKGETTRLVVNAALSGDSWSANLYGQFYDWTMSSNPTYANPDGSSAQITQFDKRAIVGLTGRKKWQLSPNLEITVGTENRFDKIGPVGVNRTDAGAFVESLGSYDVDEASGALYGEASLQPIDGLRLIAGLRGDYYRYSVRARDAAAAALGEGRGSATLLSPKIAVAWSPTSNLEFYANWGRGFHSNDARGAVNRLTPVPLLVKGTGKELGVRYQQGGLSLTATYFWLDVGSELRFVGDSNAVEPSGASRRRGFELVGFWRPFPWLALDANYTASHSRYVTGERIPNAFENAASGGASIVLDDWVASARVRHLGPSPLIEDNSVRDKGSTVVNLRGAWKRPGFELYAELLNALGSRDKDIAYYYESYIPAFDAAPVEGRLSRVVEPRTFRLGARISF